MEAKTNKQKKANLEETEFVREQKFLKAIMNILRKMRKAFISRNQEQNAVSKGKFREQCELLEIIKNMTEEIDMKMRKSPLKIYQKIKDIEIKEDFFFKLEHQFRR